MNHPDSHAGPGDEPPPATRRRKAALAGHHGDHAGALRALDDVDAGVRVAALGAVVRLGCLDTALVRRLAVDPDPGVRRRLAEELGRSAPPAPTAGPRPAGDLDNDTATVLASLIGDDDPLVAEAAAWAIGERAGDDSPHAGWATSILEPVAVGHDDPLVRESAVAALGAVGHPLGLAPVLTATADKPAVRRRAVIALAAWLDQPGVTDALQRATEDRDWQVRQLAEMLLDEHS